MVQSIPLAAVFSSRCRPWLLGSFAFLAAWMGCTYYRGEDSRVVIHDNLDANIPAYAVASRDPTFFFGGSGAVVPQFLGGIPRNCMPCELDLTILPYRYLSAFHAFVLSEAAMRVAALLGMFLLLRTYVVPEADDYVVFAASICFAILPFHPHGGLSNPGLPLLLFALLNLYQGRGRLTDWLIVAAFPFASVLVLVGFFVVPLLALWIGWRYVATRRLSGPLVIALAVLLASYLVSNYRLAWQLVSGGGYVPHRVEFATLHPLTLAQALRVAAATFRDGTYEAMSLHNPVIVIALLVALMPCLIKTAPEGRITLRNGISGLVPEPTDRGPMIAMVAMLLACATISLEVGLWSWKGTGQWIAATRIGLFQTIQLHRVFYLLPLLWGLIFAVSLEQIRRRLRSGGFFVGALFLLQVFAVSRHHGADRFPPGTTDRLTFHQFYSPELFQEIRDAIGRPLDEYRVVSLGIHPAVALYNGFYTADGYWVNYPIEYKHRFRKIIEGELAKSKDLREYFDGWGSRCYLFSSELGLDALCTKDGTKRSVRDLSLDTQALRDLGAEYILSAVEILNHRALGLKLEKVFERQDSPWQIFLYSLPRERRPPAPTRSPSL